MEIFPSRISYILIIAIAIINAILIYNSNIIFPVDQLLTPAISSAILLFISITLFSVNYTILKLKIIMTKIAYIFQGIIFLQLAWINVRVFNHASMALSFPYADNILINWDRFLNFNWKQYFYYVQNNEIVKTVFDYSYTSLTFFSFWSFIILVVQKDLKRTRISSRFVDHGSKQRTVRAAGLSFAAPGAGLYDYRHRGDCVSKAPPAACAKASSPAISTRR